MAAYESGPASTAIERELIRLLARRLGWDEGADGVLTSGGSLGNLTALLAARQARAGRDAWNEGAAAGPPLAVLTSPEAHYSVGRAAQIMGFGRAGVVPVPADGRFRMRPDLLGDALEQARRAGRRAIAVVASAGSTATGSFDPLPPIADFCAAHGLWLHVDAAHGASAAWSERYRPLLAGIERADSVVWDAHKMMLLPGLVTAVLFRDGSHSYRVFAQEAPYLYGAGDAESQWFNLGLRTLECTKRMMSLTLYGALTVFGTALFGDYVTRTFDLARRFAGRLAREADFDLATDPEGNIVCFRHLPAGPVALDAHQERIRRRLLAEGRFFVSQTRLPRGLYLRVTLMNPMTTDSDLDALLDALRAAAA
jgi:L-2,4-diaminobutyrate decarboxylase